MRHLNLEKLCPPGEADNCILICIPGARIGAVRRAFFKVAEKYEAEHVVFCVGTNHRNDHGSVLCAKLKAFLAEAKLLMVKSIFHFSALLPKIGEEWIGYTQYVNFKLKKICRKLDVDLMNSLL